jgi:PAS domain S-box-containing protein
MITEGRNGETLSDSKPLIADKEDYVRLTRVTTSLFNSTDFAGIAALITCGLHTIGFDRVRLYIPQGIVETLTLVSQCGMTDDVLGSVWQPDAEFAARYFGGTTQIHFADGANTEVPMGEPLVSGDLAQRVIIPLSMNETILAVVVADHIKSGRLIDEADLSDISLFASQAVKALHLASLLQETNRRVEQLESVRRTTMAITEQRDHEHVLGTIIEQAVQLVKAKNGGIYKYFPDTRELVVIADYRYSQHFGVILQLNEGLAGRLVSDALEGSTERFKSVLNYSESDERATVFDGTHPYGAVLEVLLRWNGEIVGVLYIDDDAGREFTAEEKQLLGLFADQAAITIANVDLVDLDQMKMRGLEKLSQAVGEIMSDLEGQSFNDRLTDIARHVTEILDCEVCYIALVENQSWLSLKASYGHRENSFQPGKQFEIRTGDKTGLLGHIAFRKQIFNECGESLRRHYAVRNDGPPPHLRSGECRSLLVVPFFAKATGTLLGVLGAENKQTDRVGSSDVKFTDADVSMLGIFSEAVVVALESAGLVSQLKQQKERYQSFVSNSPAGMMAVDMEGRVTLFNERAADILGYTAEEVLGRRVEEFYADPEEPHRIAQSLHKNNGKLNDYETAIRHKNGDEIRIRHTSNWLYDAQGNRCGSVGYFEDMRRMELLLKSSSIIAKPAPSREDLKDLVKLTASCLPHTFGRVLLRDEQKRVLEVVASHGSFITEPNIAMALDDWPGLWERVSRGESIILENKENEGQKTLEKLSRKLGLKESIQTLLVLPLLVNNKPVGMMEFGSTQPERPFTQIEQGLANALAEKVTVLLDRIRLQELTEHGQQLHQALYEASLLIRADKNVDRLLHEIVRIAARMSRCDTGGLFVIDPLSRSFGLEALHGLPDSLKDSRLPDIGVLADVAGTGIPQLVSVLPEDQQSDGDHVPSELCPQAAVPIKNEGGELEAILFVGSRSKELVLDLADLDALVRLAAQASVALQTSCLLTEEQRTFAKLNTLNAISDYFQATRDIEKMLHAQLTGVTAHYGLQFNRAALLLRGGPNTFVGRMAIGQLDRCSWEQIVERGDYIQDFQQYLEKLNRDAIEQTPLGRIISKVSFDLANCPNSIFADVVQSRLPRTVSAGEAAIFPEEFARIFDPGTPLVVVPVEFRNEVIGLLVADNKFMGAPISPADVKLLVAFTYTAASAYDKARHISELQMLNRAVHSMAQPLSRVNEGISPVGDVLQTIVNQLRHVLSCDSATVWSIVSDGPRFIAEDLRASGISKESLKVFRSLEPWRQGTTYRVLQDHWLAVADIDDPSYDFIRPEMREHLRESGVRAFQGIALLVGSEPMGVLYSSYHEPRQFSDEDRRALENFATYAALSLKNAKSLDQLISIKRAAQAIAEVSALGDYENTLKSIATGTLNAINCGAIVLYAFDPISEKWKYPPTYAGVRFPKAAWPNDVVPEDSIVNQIRKLDDLYIAEQVDEDKLFKGRRFARVEEIESCVAVPLLASGTRLGVMFVNFHKRTRFSTQQLANIKLFGHQAAVAIRNAQLFERRAETVKKQHDLLEMSEELLELYDERKILDRAAEIAAKALGTEFSNIVLPNSEGRLFFRAGYGWELDLIDKLELQEGKGSQTGYTIAERRPVSIYNYEDRNARDFEVPKLVFERGLKSGLSVPMFSEGQVVGAILVHTRNSRKFEEEESDLLRLIANQTAIALAGASRFRHVRRQSARLDALYEASKVLSASFGRTPKQMLQVILDLAINALTNPDGGRPFLGTIQLYDTETNELVLESVYPPRAHPQLVQRIKERRSLDRNTGERIGITGLAVLTGETFLVNDVRLHSEYFVYDTRTLSELAIPLRSGTRVIGVINVECDYTGAFDAEDALALKAFSDMAVIALENAKQYAELKQTKGLVGARTALAWMGMMASLWRHEIDGRAQAIINEVRNTRDHREGVPHWIELKLRLFEAQAAKIKAAPTVPALSAADTDIINLSEFISKRLETLWDRQHIYRAADLKAVPDLNVSASVLISGEWLGKLLDIFVDNAFDAVKLLEEDRRWISVDTRLADGGIELVISDGGYGFSSEALEQVFKQPVVRSTIDNQPKKGMGMGLLMADAIVEAYVGKLRVEKTGPEGTSMVIWLPITN